MKPNQKLISIPDNLSQIKKLLDELVLHPRLSAIKWSAITKQTPNIKVGYPGQHLASLITGMKGERTGARGNDLIDGSEVKSCSRIDQLDQCLACKAAVARLETECPQCGSPRINRKNDSKWLFTIRSEEELRVLTQEVPRIVLILGDYPRFDESDFNTLRFQAFEIWTQSRRNRRFVKIMENYYKHIYLSHKRANPNKTPAPKNFWPYSYQFYMCNPILTFSCVVKAANTRPKLALGKYIEPGEDRAMCEVISMPHSILTDEELTSLIQKATLEELNTVFKQKVEDKKDLQQWDIRRLRENITGINEALRERLPLRDTDKIATVGTTYSRRRNV